MTTSYTLTGKIRDIAGAQARSAMAFLSTNLGELGLSDLDANEVRLSAAWRVPLATDGTFSISLIGTNQATTNIAPNTLRYRITVHHKDPSGQQLTWDSGLFAHTAPQDLSDVVAAGVPPVLANEYLSKSLVDAKGDLLVGTAADTVSRLPVGANNTMLFADSSQASGLRWGDKFLAPVVIERSATEHVRMVRADAAVDAKRWQAGVGSDGTLILATYSDAGVFQSQAMQLQRDGERVQFGGGLTLIRGTGFPEGVVSAPVGSRYVDTAATNGAVEWVKASGTGNTGWRVVYGDTGWRNIGSLLLNGWTATTGIFARRTAETFTLRCEALSAASATSQIFLTTAQLIPGFRFDVASGNGPRHLLHMLTTPVTTRRVFSGSSGSDMNVPNYSATDVLYGDLTGPASSTWPSSLPGTAV